MKVTIDVPAPSQLLELISRLKQKNRNYKTQLKQLQRAHFITKRLLEDRQWHYDNALVVVGKQAAELQRMRNELMYAWDRARDAGQVTGCWVDELTSDGVDFAAIEHQPDVQIINVPFPEQERSDTAPLR